MIFTMFELEFFTGLNNGIIKLITWIAGDVIILVKYTSHQRRAIHWWKLPNAIFLVVLVSNT